MEYKTLNNGVEIPKLGFGVWQIFDQAECQKSVEDALEVGYRLIDTAALYKNEEAVGQAIKASGIKREDVFITTKAWINQLGYDKTKKAFETSLKKLGTDYLDLYLIHQPYGDTHGAWRAMSELYKGRIRAIGVSNFSTGRVTDFAINTDIVPALNQIELHPYKQQTILHATNQELGVATQAGVHLTKEKMIFLKTLRSIASLKNTASLSLKSSFAGKFKTTFLPFQNQFISTVSKKILTFLILNLPKTTLIPSLNLTVFQTTTDQTKLSNKSNDFQDLVFEN